MRKIFFCLAVSLFSLASIVATAQVPFDMPEVAQPKIPAYEVALTDFGAVGDGQTLCTEAFSKAMKHLASKGGGRLVVPEGLWLTGPIQFESCTELHLDRGALVIFTTDYDEYPFVKSIYEGNTAHKKMSPLWAYEKHDVAITGFGAFDGTGEAWRQRK